MGQRRDAHRAQRLIIVRGRVRELDLFCVSWGLLLELLRRDAQPIMCHCIVASIHAADLTLIDCGSLQGAARACRAALAHIPTAQVVTSCTARTPCTHIDTSKAEHLSMSSRAVQSAGCQSRCLIGVVVTPARLMHRAPCRQHLMHIVWGGGLPPSLHRCYCSIYIYIYIYESWAARAAMRTVDGTHTLRNQAQSRI